jgi:pyruvate/2-oxoacid:ferredoxin oxidoreductase beta subunit/Pyruvate/2-oxoacid:ferredoxin oxidoreductase gamma subunit
MTEGAIQTYLNESMKPYPFCPGCGHAIIMDQLNAALVKLQLDPRKVAVVVDIGCVALTREFFATNWMLGLHGRAATYATGIKLANPDLKVIVLMGDGGFGIGGHHVLNAARRNIGLTVLAFDNFNFGMTGGQHSVTTPQGAVTSTTRHGHLERPLDICATVAVNGASFVARTTTFDKGLPDLLAEAISNEGFSLVDVWELCTSYYVPNNRYGRKQLESALESLGYQTGIIHREQRPEYSREYRVDSAAEVGRPALRASPVLPKYGNGLGKRTGCVVAGAAGKKIISAATSFCRGAVLSGLWVSQSNAYPVTVGTGYSTSTVILSPDEILFTGISKPDVMVALFPEGLNVVREQVKQLTPDDSLYISSRLLPVETGAKQVVLDFDRAGGGWGRKQEYWAIMALAEVLRHSKVFPVEALQEALADGGSYAEQNLEAVEASRGLIVGP